MKRNLVKSLPSQIKTPLKYVIAYYKGMWPTSRAHDALVSSANLNTLSGKIRYKMAFDRNPLLTMLADKSEVRNYVEERVGAKYLVKQFGVFENSAQLRGFTFPSEFVIKSNHGSGGLILVSSQADQNKPLPKKINKGDWSVFQVHPKRFNVENAIRISSTWLKQNYCFRVGKFPEWAYKNIKPVILVEEFLRDIRGGLPWDYKLTMINGKCEFIQVRTMTERRDLFTPEWEPIEGTNLYSSSEVQISKPLHLREMIEVAEKLSKGIDFIRVDLYETDMGVKFGELTNYPDGGLGTFEPLELDFYLGAKWSPNY